MDNNETVMQYTCIFYHCINRGNNWSQIITQILQAEYKSQIRGENQVYTSKNVGTV
jgi:hypothetical protein